MKKQIKRKYIVMMLVTILLASCMVGVIACKPREDNKNNCMGCYKLKYKLTAGCSVSDCIKIKNPTNKNLHLKITYKILPDSEGITFTITKDIIIKKGQTGKICFTIDTDLLLVPGVYHIEIIAYKITNSGNHYGQCK